MVRTIYLVVAVTILSCSGRQSSNDNASVGVAANGHSARLMTFEDLPEEIDGCGCYFYLSVGDQSQGKYLFVNDFAQIAYVSINGKIVRFELQRHEQERSIYEYLSGRYALYVRVLKKQDAEGEGSNVSGIIRLSIDKEVDERSFVGYCGC